ncbi:CopG family ribbon-helix-helix protein [Streptomyces chartreusis]
MPAITGATGKVLVKVSALVPVELRDRLDVHARAEHGSRATVLRQALSAWLAISPRRERGERAVSDEAIRACWSCDSWVYPYRVDGSRSTVDWPDVFLDDLELPDPALGEVELTASNEAVVGDLGTGPYLIHRCPERATRCLKYGNLVRRINRADRAGSRRLFLLVDTLPNPDGTVTLDANRHATTDLHPHPDSERYTVHRDLPAKPPRLPNPLGLPRRAEPGLAPSSIHHAFRGDGASA